MINLSEYAQIVINEGLLDDIDDQLEAGDKMVDIQRAEKWASKSRRKPWIAKQKKGYALFGDFVIDDIDEKIYTGTPIKKIVGSISISGCEIESLEGIFLNDCEIDGSLTIEDCPNLVSLDGGPLSCKNMTISGCKKLKDLHCRTVVSGNLFLHNNGKKFKEEAIRKDDKNIYVIKKIFCSELGELANLNESEYINEAFAAPQLHILADAINSVQNKNSEYKTSMTEFMARVQLDKIKSSQIHVYDGNDPWAIKDAKYMMQGKRSGFYYTINNAGEVTYLFAGTRALQISDRYGKIDRYTSWQYLKQYQINDIITHSDTLVIVDVEGMETLYQIRKDRENLKKDATAFKIGKERTGKSIGNYWDDRENKIDSKQVRYYQEIANENRERYKRMVTKIKAERSLMSGNFEKYNNQIAKLFDRYTALLSKIIKNPEKYGSYELGWLHDEFKSAKLSGTGKYRYITDDGLFTVIQKYFMVIMDAKKGHSGTKDVQESIKSLEANLERRINKIDAELTSLENK